MEREPSGWAVGWTTFAAFMMILIGVFHAIAGLAAIVDDTFVALTQDYVFKFDTTTWGWIHLLPGSSSCWRRSACSAARCGLAPSA